MLSEGLSSVLFLGSLVVEVWSSLVWCPHAVSCYFPTVPVLGALAVCAGACCVLLQIQTFVYSVSSHSGAFSPAYLTYKLLPFMLFSLWLRSPFPELSLLILNSQLLLFLKQPSSNAKGPVCFRITDSQGVVKEVHEEAPLYSSCGSPIQ